LGVFNTSREEPDGRLVEALAELSRDTQQDARQFRAGLAETRPRSEKLRAALALTRASRRPPRSNLTRSERRRMCHAYL
jgi:hypothetical protein